MCFTIIYTIYILFSTCNKFNCPVMDKLIKLSLLLYTGCYESLRYVTIMMIMIIIIEFLKLL